MEKENKHLYYLEELSDYKVDSHYSDVTGWPVKDLNNRVIGKVDNLLVNKELERVVYLDVEVDRSIIEANHDPYGRPANIEIREFVNKEGENHIIIPIGMVSIDDDQKFVYTESIDHQTFSETKRVNRGTLIDRDYEKVVLGSYNREHSDRRTNPQFVDDTKIIQERESPYRSDRDISVNDHKSETHDRKIDKNQDDWSAERRALEDERKKLREERLKLKEERERLKAERVRYDNYRERSSANEDLDLDDTNDDLLYDKNLYENDRAFYDRKEFGNSNYKND
ncbi:hypothetical protein [Gillisia sp. Hel_I_29]|uniref:hypothetical protein n=1 Tax=Gillisia sp. Hel_I_29 TaxID=1249975 RepID=UPI000A69B196|nr:hypothetical protein [Gillisia sp. Hel_I_29]